MLPVSQYDTDSIFQLTFTLELNAAVVELKKENSIQISKPKIDVYVNLPVSFLQEKQRSQFDDHISIYILYKHELQHYSNQMKRKTKYHVKKKLCICM